MSTIILWLISLIPTGKFKPITYWKHREGKYLYLCMSEIYIKNEKVFNELFEKAIRISKTEFDAILYFNEEIEIVTVADDKITHLIDENKIEQHSDLTEEFTAEMQDEIDESIIRENEYNSGWENQHEESEDKNITNE